jgi:Tfp pilus assembly protein PilF
MLWSQLRFLLFRPGRGRQQGTAPARGEAAIAAAAARADEHEAAARKALATGDSSEAIAQLRTALDADPARADLQCLLGAAHAQAGDLEEARDCYTLALHHAPGHLDGYLGLGSLLQRHGQHEEALAIYTEGIQRLPQAAQLHSNRALQLFELDRPEDALESCLEAVRLDPELFEAWHNLGLVKLHLDAPIEALQAFDRALQLRPSVLATMACRGHALRDQGRVTAALRVYEQVLRRDRGFDDAIRNLAYTQLLRRDFDSGWRNYQWRFGPPGPPFRGFPFPAWRGEPLAGKSLLVLAEQGIGDEVMFASCLPEVVRTCGRCVVECNTRLAALYRRSFAAASIRAGEKGDGHEWLQTIGPIDFQVPIGDLPRYLRRRASDFPRHNGYLLADPERLQRWRSFLDRNGAGRPAVGIVWRGGTLKTRSRSRSVPLQLFEPLLRAMPVQWVSLQRGATTPVEDALLQELGVLEVSLEGGDEIEELAALLGALDHVVSIATSVVHLAGALGRPVSVLLPLCPEWRYGNEGSEMLWYPSARLYRQSVLGSWTEPLQGVLAELQALFGSCAP